MSNVPPTPQSAPVVRGTSPRATGSVAGVAPKLASVVVLNWNGRQHLEACLAVLREQTYQPREIIVVDNGSTDGSTDFVQQRFPEVTLLRSPTNLGFAAGSNLGLRVARGAYLATLNNDTLPDPHWLEELVRAMEADPSLGMCASKVLSWDGAAIDSAGIALDRAGIAWERAKGQPAADEEDAAQVFGPSAAAALYRRAVLDEVGLFDERFFCFLEDVDLAWRARGMGWRCLYVPTARVRHYHSATAGEGSAFKRYLLARNKAWTIAKNYPSPYLWLHLPAIVLCDLLAVAYALAFCTPSWEAKWAVVRGRLAALAGLGKALRDRQKVQRQCRLTAAEMLGLMEPLPGPWRARGERASHITARLAP